MIYLILLLISGVKMPGEVFTFTTTGSTFDPIIVLDGSPDFHWFFSNKTFSTAQDPASIDFGSIANRDQKFWIEDYTKITQINWGGQDVGFDINELQSMTGITYLKLSSTSCSGDIANLSGMTGMTGLNLYSTSCSGDIANLSGMTGMTVLRLYSTSCSGDIANLSGMTGMADLRLYSTSCSGDIANLSGMTGMTYLNLTSTSCSGDIANLSGMTGMADLYLSSTSCSYTSTSLPNWSGAEIQIYSCGLSSSEVDDFLIDLDTGTGEDDTGGTLNIAGTNEARTSDSDAAKANLITKNWTITVKE